MILRGGLTLNGRLAMGPGSYLVFNDTQTLSAGTIEFTGSGATVDIPPNVTVTFGAGVTVRGHTGTISGGGTLIHQGKISADTAGGTIRIQPTTFVNNGQLEAINGGILIAPGFP